jgi:hypothetical protein
MNLENYIEDKNGCWLWQGYIARNGYGRIKVDKKAQNVHRISWEFHFGDIKDDMSILHRCPNKHCMNPDHLYLGTQRDVVQKTWDFGGKKEWRVK